MNKLISKTQYNYEHIRIVVFCISATFGWLCTDNPAVNKVIRFYSYRIRQYTKIHPKAETILINVQKEKSFNPADLTEALSIHNHIEVKIVYGQH